MLTMHRNVQQKRSSQGLEATGGPSGLRAELRSMSYADGAARLSPGPAPVQLKAVQKSEEEAYRKECETAGGVWQSESLQCADPALLKKDEDAKLAKECRDSGGVPKGDSCHEPEAPRKKEPSDGKCMEKAPPALRLRPPHNGPTISARRPGDKGRDFCSGGAIWDRARRNVGPGTLSKAAMPRGGVARERLLNEVRKESKLCGK